MPALVDAEEGRKQAVAAPRGEAKSTIITLMFVLWCIVTGRKRFIPIIADAFEQACRDARAIIIAHHYSHRVVNNSYLHLGVFREGALEGVLQWGYALCPARAGKVVEGTVQGQYMELNRMGVK